MRSHGYWLGVVGLALSDATMYYRMATMGDDGTLRLLAFWVGVVGAVAGYAGWLLWLGVVLRARAGKVGRGSVVDGVLIGASTASVFALAVVLPQLRSTGPHIDQVWFLGCLAADALLLWLAFTLLVTRPGDRRALVVLIGIGLHVVVDTLHASALGPPTELRMRVSELVLVATFITWLGALAIRRSGSPAEGATHRVAKARSAGLVIALVAPGLVAAVRFGDGFGADLAFFVGSVTMLAVLVSMRIRGLVADLATSAAELAHRANHDHLTGVWNRSALADFLTAGEGTADGGSAIRAVLYLDLDGFKAVNDTFGHDAGDAVLVEVAGRVQNAVRGVDRVARVGGDEFVVVVTDVDTDVEAFVDRLDRVLNRADYEWAGTALDLGVSVGLARRSADRAGTNSDLYRSLLAEADLAMLEAKQERKQEARAENRSEPDLTPS